MASSIGQHAANGEHACPDAISGGGAAASADLTDLPNDLFLLVIWYIPSRDAIRCRRVSRAWNAAFTAGDTSWNLMRWHFSRSREARAAAAETAGQMPDWTALFARVARRYHFLRGARAREVEKIEVVQEGSSLEKGAGGPLQVGVEPWMRVLKWNDSTAVFQYREPTWTADGGLLVYQEPGSARLVAYDLESRARQAVPFDARDRIVRRVRLAFGVLVVEWCERAPYHNLNERTAVHRHFATAYDVRRCASSSCDPLSASPTSSPLPPQGCGEAWSITLRSEWKIHFLGLPVTAHDRFFSTHTSTHYALYIWQPNRSPWGEEDPLEQIVVWDISSPSSYKPSLDPTGIKKPDESLCGPKVIQRLTWRDLDAFNLRQRHNPSLRALFLDEANVYVHEEDHRWLFGPHSNLSPPRHHHVRCTSIPFTGYGPRWFDECCADGDVHLSFCPRAGSAARLSGAETSTSPCTTTIASSCSSSSFSTHAGHSGNEATSVAAWPGLSPCWRHEEFPYLTVSEMVDGAAGVRIVARQCFMVEALSVFVLPRISVESEGEGDEVRFADELWGELMGKGVIRGDERWVVGEDSAGRVTVLRF